MPAPTLTGPSERLADFLEPWLADDAAYSYAFSWIAAAIGGMFTDVENVIRYDDVNDAPGWARVFDPDNAPEFALPWLAMLAGQPYDPNLPAAVQREWLRPDANKRGTSSTIKAAVQTRLTGTKRVILRERTSTAYQHEVITYLAETPDAALVVDVLADPTVKPVGHWFTHTVAPGWSIEEMETAYAAQTIADLEGDFTTINDLEANVP